MTILVTGANGNIATMTIQQLRAAGKDVRAVVRDESKAGPLREAGCEVVVHDFDKPVPASLFEGVSSALFLTAPNAQADQQMHHLIEAAKGTNVHVVRLSAIGAAADAPTANGRLHHTSDEELIASGLKYTILRPSWFMQNIFWGLESIAKEGKIYQGMGDGSIGMIDVRDIAEVAAHILQQGGHVGETLTLTGPASVTWHDFASAVGTAIDQQVDYIPVPVEAVKQGVLGMGMGEWFADLMADYSTAYSQNWGNIVTEDVANVLGKPARSIEAFSTEVLAPALQATA